ncbi:MULTISPECIES: hypothetical protein [unclassified Paraburkholderia]|uniref:hypothetical protein n=1 Tax=unclassified Paraburkholderia TaxID=2615204 RepID=UPI002AAF210C|nr:MULTISPECIES: hypothetical protein [unclassified Paraburkholderia]
MKKAMAVRMINEYGAPSVCFEMDGNAALFDAEELDGLIEELCRMRSTMRPGVPHTPSRTHQYVMEMNPSWYTERTPLFDGAALFLRHSGLGWACFALPVESLQKLADALYMHIRENRAMQPHLTLN